MSLPTYPIQGIPLSAGVTNPPARKEITAWVNDPNNERQVSLFTRALTEFQQLSPTQDPLSYYRIAGIHGDPDVSWDGVGNPPGPGLAGWWCAHNKPTFSTWHRPYLTLFEQRIYEIMEAIIRRDIPVARRTIWQDAAKDWRLPYWDWAAVQGYINDYGVPEIFTKEQIVIVDFADNSPPTRVDIANPLWKFSNPAGVAMGHRSMGIFRLRGYPWNRATATSRWGIVTTQPEATWKDGVNDWRDANDALQNPSQIGWLPASTEDAVYRLFANNFTSWESFESKVLHSGTPTDYLSLEFVHDGIHPLTGGWEPTGRGLGHFADPSVSAFDPIFWFHHCNIDRLAAIFQTLHPTMWFAPGSPTGGGLGSAPLNPFHQDTVGTAWTSNTCRNWRTSLKYDYDDFTTTSPPVASATSPPVDSASILSLAADSTGELQRRAQEHVSTLKRRINDKYGVVRRELNKSPDIEGHKNDYVLNIIYDRYALDGAPYFIHFFLGAPPGEVSFFTHANSYIGSVYTFSSSLEESGATAACQNCLQQRKEEVLSTAQIPITNVILGYAKDPSRLGIHSLKPDEVESYLEKNLSWRAVIAIEESGDPLSSGLIIMARLPRTKIFAMKGTVHHPDDESELSSYSNYIPLWRATAGKPGGASEDGNTTT